MMILFYLKLPPPPGPPPGQPQQQPGGQAPPPGIGFNAGGAQPPPAYSASGKYLQSNDLHIYIFTQF